MKRLNPFLKDPIRGSVMNTSKHVPEFEERTALLRAVLKSQYHAALAMLREAIHKCPEELWFSERYKNACWQIAYHTLYFTHLYLQPDEKSFRPWEHHQANVQHPDGFGPPQPDNPLPVIPRPYTQEEALMYWDFCDAMVDRAVDALDLDSPHSGFSWCKVPKLEHQLVNIRHIEHHMAQLADRLRSSAEIGVRWVSAVRQEEASSEQRR